MVPNAALLVLIGLENATHHSALIDAHGVLFDRSPTWRGARLAWDAMLGFRIVEGGVRLVVRGRPWTRFVGPTIPCDGEVMHRVVEAPDCAACGASTPDGGGQSSLPAALS